MPEGFTETTLPPSGRTGGLSQQQLSIKQWQGEVPARRLSSSFASTSLTSVAMANCEIDVLAQSAIGCELQRINDLTKVKTLEG
jgi:hypothetical protein